MIAGSRSGSRSGNSSSSRSDPARPLTPATVAALCGPRAARGYKRDGDEAEPVSSPSVLVGDGNQFSSLEDLAKWDAGLRAHKLVSQDMQLRAYTAGKLDDGEQHSYGFGWRDTEDDDHPAVTTDVPG